MIIKILIGIVLIIIGLLFVVRSIRKSMIDGNNIGNFIEEEEINHESRKMMAQDDRLDEFIDDLNSQKDGEVIIG